MKRCKRCKANYIQAILGIKKNIYYLFLFFFKYVILVMKDEF